MLKSELPSLFLLALLLGLAAGAFCYFDPAGEYPPYANFVFLYAKMLAVFTFFHLSLVLLTKVIELARLISRVGFQDYRRWVLVRDLQLLFIPAAVGFLLVTGMPWWFFAGFCIYFINMGKAVAFPHILMLHTFDPVNRIFPTAVSNLFRAVNVVSLWPQHTSRWTTFWITNSYSAGVGARVSSDEEWRQFIRQYMKWTEVVLIDLSSPRAGTLEEFEFIIKDKELLRKTLFVCRPESRATNVWKKLDHMSLQSQMHVYTFDADLNPGHLFLRRENFLHSDSRRYLLERIGPMLQSVPSFYLWQRWPFDYYQWFFYMIYVMPLLLVTIFKYVFPQIFSH